VCGDGCVCFQIFFIVFACLLVYLHACMCTCMHAYIHTCMHACMHAYQQLKRLCCGRHAAQIVRCSDPALVVSTPPPPPPPPCTWNTLLPCAYEGCIFDKTADTNALTRSGDCSGYGSDLYLNSKGIELIPAGVLDGIGDGISPQ
jgi:hypothetical protein